MQNFPLLSALSLNGRAHALGMPAMLWHHVTWGVSRPYTFSPGNL